MGQDGTDLNLILAYITYVGDWKNISATDVIAAKRRADAILFTYRPFFSDKFIAAYQAFMASSFETYRTRRADAGIRTSPEGRKGERKGAFASSYDLQGTYQAYNQLLDAGGDDFGLKSTAPVYRAPCEPGAEIQGRADCLSAEVQRAPPQQQVSPH